MSSKCRDVGNVRRRKAGPTRESHASSRGEGWESDAWRAEGRGTIRKSLEGGMAACLLSPSLSVLSVRSDSAREGADGKVAWAEVAYWRLPRRKPRKWRVRWVSDSPGVWLLSGWPAKLVPLAGPREERYGAGVEGGALGPSGCLVSLTMSAVGDVRPLFCASNQLLFAGGWWLRWWKEDSGSTGDG